MKSLIFFSAIIFSALCVRAQNYNILMIPDSLMKNANVVDRYSEMHLTIINEKKAILYEKQVYTILNEAGDKYADYTTYYDKFNSINDLDGSLYDASGKKLKEVKRKDISDHASYDGYSLMIDARYKEHNFYCRDYPYTVEYEEEDEQNQMFSLPTWDPQISALMSVQASKLIVEAPSNYKFRYKQFNLKTEPQITQKGDKVIYTWEVDNLTTKKYEVYQPGWRDIMPSVMLAPTTFGLDDYTGDMNTWKGFGDFINTLRKNRDVLPDNVKQKVHALTDNVKDPREKVDILYKYLQENSRYVSVQLGVGGWQPFDANYVATNKYGDCKALSNYMVALLSEAGIKADYVLIKAGEGEEPIQTDFPINQFNHATVCVPLDKDSIWLECTSQTKSTGYAGTFTGNRYALLVDENGGHIVRTPQYNANDNLIIRNIEGTVDSAGNLTAKVFTHYAACESDDVQLRLDYADKKRIEDVLKEEFDLPTYDVTSYNYKQNKGMIPSVDEDLQINATNYASAMGKRFFLMPNVITHLGVKIDTSEKRVYDIVLDDPFTHIDSVSIKLSGKYTVESLPKDVNLNTPYGSYSISFKYQDNTVSCVRKFQQNASRFPSSAYADFGAFVNTIYKSDRSKMVFIKKESN